MSASVDPTESPEWEAARSEWWEQAKGQLETLQKAVNGATPGSLALETIYAPMHDMAGLAGVFGYDMLGKIARSLIETLRKGANPLDDRMLMVASDRLSAFDVVMKAPVPGKGKLTVRFEGEDGKVIAKMTTPSNPNQRPRTSTAGEGFKRVSGRTSSAQSRVTSAIFTESGSV